MGVLGLANLRRQRAAHAQQIAAALGISRSLDFCQRVAQAQTIFTGFRQIAEGAQERLTRAVQRLG